MFYQTLFSLGAAHLFTSVTSRMEQCCGAILGKQEKKVLESDLVLGGSLDKIVVGVSSIPLGLRAAMYV